MDRTIYIPTRELIARRACNTAVQIPNVLSARRSTNTPVALLFRQIATPNFELYYFIRKSRRLGFEPVIIEHLSDQFSVHNPYKRSLVVMPIVSGRNRHRQIIWHRQKLAHLDDVEGRKLNTIKLSSGESLVSYHHRKLYGVFGRQTPRLVNLDKIIASVDLGAKFYYQDLLCLLSGNVVLFEDFVVDRQTAAFFSETVMPAYEAATRKMGCAPQIARMMFGKRAALPIWNSYPETGRDNIVWETQDTFGAATAS